MAEKTRYSSRQPMRGNVRRMMLLAVAPVPVLVGIGAWYQLVLGEDPPGGSGASLPDWVVVAVLVVGGVLLPLALARLHLRIRVTDDRLVATLWPLRRRGVAIADIEHHEIERFDAFRDFGGWGIKGEKGVSLALLADGGVGVRLQVRDAKDLVLSCDDPEALDRALSLVRARDPSDAH